MPNAVPLRGGRNREDLPVAIVADRLEADGHPIARRELLGRGRLAVGQREDEPAGQGDQPRDAVEGQHLAGDLVGENRPGGSERQGQRATSGMRHME